MIWITLSVEAVGFAMAIFFVWADEVFDIPRRIFGTEATPVNLSEAAIESLYILIFAAITIAITRSLLRRIRYLEGLIPVCMVCRRVHSGEEWVPMDVYIRDHSEADITHGLCDECAEKAYGFDPAAEEEAYK